ncbi:MAG: hypothetical protein FJ218_10445 [Ignavibacteria bacterium]|nr:hypothetical protein [Ignavibacteria bacterium]
MDDPRGVFAFGNDTLKYSKTTDSAAVKSLQFTLGAGYGRVTEERAVAQAIVVLKELGADASNENILKLAEIIRKNSDGYYLKTFKDDASIEYYKDIAAITGKAEDAIKVGRILGGGIYQTSTRWNGWWVMASFSDTILTTSSFSKIIKTSHDTTWIDHKWKPKGSIGFGGEYAMPMDLDKQFKINASYNMDLNKKDTIVTTSKDTAGISSNDTIKVFPTNSIKFGALFTIDHNYLWTSKVQFDFTNFMPAEGDGWSDWSLSAESNYFVLNQMSVYGLVKFSSNNSELESHKDAKMRTDFKVGARYYIW